MGSFNLSAIIIVFILILLSFSIMFSSLSAMREARFTKKKLLDNKNEYKDVCRELQDIFMYLNCPEKSVLENELYEDDYADINFKIDDDKYNLIVELPLHDIISITNMLNSETNKSILKNKNMVRSSIKHEIVFDNNIYPIEKYNDYEKNDIMFRCVLMQKEFAPIIISITAHKGNTQKAKSFLEDIITEFLKKKSAAKNAATQ